MAPDLDLVNEEVREHARSTIDATRPEPFGVYVGVGDDSVAKLARHVETTVFGETFGNTPELLAQEYDRYAAASLYFCVVDHRRQLPVGMARSILPSPAGLKSLDDLGREWGQDVDELLARTGITRDHAWDCATIATMPDYRRGALFGLVSMAIYQALAITPLRTGYRWWVSVLDVPVYRVVQWRLGRPLTTYEGVEPTSYLGSAASVPIWSDLEAWRTRLAETDPALHEVVFRGIGLEHGVAPLDWSRVDNLVDQLNPARLATRSADATPTA